MNRSSTRAARSLIMALRDEAVTVTSPSSEHFGLKCKCFGSLVRASRALSAWEAGDREATLRKLDELFAYFTENFPEEISQDECRRVLARHQDRLVVTEAVLPVLITKYVLRRVRLDMAAVPNFAPWARRYEKAVL